MRQHDGDESVRFEVVKAIVATAKWDFGIVSESEDLLNYVKERTLDKKVKINSPGWPIPALELSFLLRFLL